jgi:hypothetical protein
MFLAFPAPETYLNLILFAQKWLFYRFGPWRKKSAIFEQFEQLYFCVQIRSSGTDQNC